MIKIDTLLKSIQHTSRLNLISLCFAFLFCSFLTSNSSANNTITWVNEDFPPAFIIEGPNKGNGITDGAVDIYKEQLSNYEHKHVVANMARILAMIKEGQEVCYAGFIKTPEREKYIEFSIPNIITYSNALILTKEKAKAVFGCNNLSL